MTEPLRIETFDTQALGLSGFTAVHLIHGNTPILVDAGTKDSSDDLIAWLRSRGVSPRVVIVTHAHHDHIGGLASLVRTFGAEVYSSPVGAQKLCDPMTANRIYGVPGLEPVDHVRIVQDGEELEWDGCRLRMYLTPGHSEDSLSVHELGSDTLFPGDLAGDWLWESTFLPPCASEDFNEIAFLASLDRMASLRACRIALAHYGLFEGDVASALLRDQRARYQFWKDALVDAYGKRQAVEDVALRVRELLFGSHFEQIDGWVELSAAFAGWCLLGLRQAGQLPEPPDGEMT